MSDKVDTEKHELCVMDPEHGDLKVIWDPKKPEEVAAAEKQFKDMKDKGYQAYRVDEDGEKTEVMHKFDKKAKAVIMAPVISGG
jgi:hypothetical protein